MKLFHKAFDRDVAGKLLQLRFVCEPWHFRVEVWRVSNLGKLVARRVVQPHWLPVYCLCTGNSLGGALSQIVALV